jgi:hypothetical protein
MLEEIRARRNTQPKGKSAGCIYKTEDKSAGWYIEQAGLKNKRVGDIYVSPIHAGFFINAGKGCAKDMLKLMDYVEKTVEDKFNNNIVLHHRLFSFLFKSRCTMTCAFRKCTFRSTVVQNSLRRSRMTGPSEAKDQPRGTNRVLPGCFPF